MTGLHRPIKAEKEPTIRARCQTFGFPLSTAILFNTICFWYPKARATYKGEKFLADSRDALGAKAGISPKQVKSGLSRLKKAGLLRLEYHFFAGKRVCHMQPNLVRLEALERDEGESALHHPSGADLHHPNRPKGTAPLGQKGPLMAGPKGTIPPGQKGPATTALSYCSSTASSSVYRASPEEPSPLRVEEPLPEESDSRRVWKKESKAEASPQDPKGETPAAPIPNPDQSSEPRSLTVPEMLGMLGRAGADLPDPQDRKAMGQTAGFCKAYLRGVEGTHPGEARDALANALDDWRGFCRALEKEYEAYDLPHQPAAWVIARFVAPTINIWRSTLESRALSAQLAIAREERLAQLKTENAELARREAEWQAAQPSEDDVLAFAEADFLMVNRRLYPGYTPELARQDVADALARNRDAFLRRQRANMAAENRERVTQAV